MHNKSLIYIIFSLFSMKNVIASPFCIYPIIQEKVELFMMTLPTDTCLTELEKKYVERQTSSMSGLKSVEDRCIDLGLITKSTLKEKIENKEEPSVICSINRGIFNGCVTPWGGKVYYESNQQYNNFYILGFENKKGDIIQFPFIDNPSKKGMSFHYEPSFPKNLDSVGKYNRPAGAWTGLCSTFEEVLQTNKLIPMGKEFVWSIKLKYNLYKKSGTQGSVNSKPLRKFFANMVQRSYEFSSNVFINSDESDDF